MVYNITHNDGNFIVCEFEVEPKVTQLINNSFSFKITTVTFTTNSHFKDVDVMAMCVIYQNEKTFNRHEFLEKYLLPELNFQFNLNEGVVNGRTESVDKRRKIARGTSTICGDFVASMSVIDKINPYYQWAVLGNSDEL